jgi:hypothetical protein
LYSRQQRSFTALAQVNALTAARLPKKIVSVDKPVEIRSTLPPSCAKVISKLKYYERSRLNLQDDFVCLMVKVTRWRSWCGADEAA